MSKKIAIDSDFDENVNWIFDSKSSSSRTIFPEIIPGRVNDEIGFQELYKPQFYHFLGAFSQYACQRFMLVRIR